MKYLVAGLGNIGKEYNHTRHNIGFEILDALASASNIVFEDRRYGFVSEYKYKGRTFILLRPTTYVNLSGRAVNYWLKKEDIPLSNLLVICDDLALPFGTVRLKSRGATVDTTASGTSMRYWVLTDMRACASASAIIFTRDTRSIMCLGSGAAKRRRNCPFLWRRASP